MSHLKPVLQPMLRNVDPVGAMLVWQLGSAFGRGICILLTVLALAPAAAADDQTRITAAKTFVQQVFDEKYEEAATRFDATMTRSLPVSAVKKIHTDLTRQYGKLQKADKTKTQSPGEYEIVYVTLEFEKGDLAARVVFDAKEQIAGLFFVPAEQYQSPAYVKQNAFREEEVSLGNGALLLPGTLTLPTNPQGKVAAVVLVHGSGPNDRDETIGPNKPFRDLAHGLATRGIAVLRYEKRTRQHQVLMALNAKLTVKEETIDDAVAAVDLLRKRSEIDPQRVFVIGHSLGAMLVPAIAELQPDACGFVCLAGNTQPLQTLIAEQTKYLVAVDGQVTPEEKAHQEKILQQVALVDSDKLTETTARGELPFAVPPAYWIHLNSYNVATSAARMTRPVMVLQGERDYQVTMEDFAGWKKAFKGKQRVLLKSYPTLNHLFITGEGKSRPQEYNAAGNVAEEVIVDIAEWIGSQSPLKK